jgi:hypothetical protein
MKLELQAGNYGRVRRSLISDKGRPEEEPPECLRSLKSSLRQNHEAKFEELIASTEYKDALPRR